MSSISRYAATIDRMKATIESFEGIESRIDDMLTPQFNLLKAREIGEEWSTEDTEGFEAQSEEVPQLIKEMQQVVEAVASRGPLWTMMTVQLMKLQARWKDLRRKVEILPTSMANTHKIETVIDRMKEAIKQNSLDKLDLVKKSVVELVNDEYVLNFQQTLALSSLEFNVQASYQQLLENTLSNLYQFVMGFDPLEIDHGNALRDALPAQVRNALLEKVGELSCSSVEKVRLWDDIDITERALIAIIKKTAPELLDTLDIKEEEKINSPRSEISDISEDKPTLPISPLEQALLNFEAAFESLPADVSARNTETRKLIEAIPVESVRNKITYAVWSAAPENTRQGDNFGLEHAGEYLDVVASAVKEQCDIALEETEKVPAAKVL